MNKIITATILVAFLFSCSQAKKLEKAKRVFDNHSLEASEYCYLKFPVENTIEYREGKTITDTVTLKEWQLDTLYLQTDEIEPVKIVTQVKYKTIFKTKIDTVYKSIENTAKVTAYETRLIRSETIQRELTKEMAGKIDQLNSKNKWLLWLLIIIGLQSIYILRTPLLKLFI